MCYHVSSPGEKKLKEYATLEDLEYTYEGEIYYHVSGFNRPYLPVTLNAEPGKIAPARWKLLPFWVKTEADAKKYANTLNADSAEIFNKKSYSPFILKNKGLLYVDGFYEPHKVEGIKHTENFYIFKPEKQIFTLGIVFAPWTDQPTGEHYNTFSVITVPANPLLEKIHNEKKRMPLIIPEEAQNDWLNTTSKEGTESFFQPYQRYLEAHRVIRVTGARGIDTNIPEIQDPI